MDTLVRHAPIRSLRRYAVVTATILAAWAAAPVIAHAYQEPNTMGEAVCLTCHEMRMNEYGAYVFVDNPAGGDCVACHGAAPDASPYGVGYTSTEFSGPHSGYTTTTRKCATCHSVHKSPADSILLLPGATIVDTCETCHDGTGGWGVYGAVRARTGLAPGGGHRVDVTRQVPGGDLFSGSETTGSFSGAGGTLICTDCHSPHGADVVTAFLGERRRIRQGTPPPVSTKILRRSPTGSAAPVDEKGSDWCLGCHAGRASGGAVHNHPVESAVTWPTASTRFVYDRLAVLNSALATKETVIGRLGGTPKEPLSDPRLYHEIPATNETGNRGFLMPWPRTLGVGGQGTHLPICQQCHEDSREAGDLAADGSGTAAPFTTQHADGVVLSGSEWVTATVGTVNPMFQNFPHETENRRMLVEEDDDLCLNCHPMSQLP